MRSILLSLAAILLVSFIGSNSLIAQNTFKTKAEKYEADGLPVPAEYATTDKTLKVKKKKVAAAGKNTNSKSPRRERCTTSDALERRLKDANYRNYREGLVTKVSLEKSSIPCDAGNSIIIPVAIHFNNAYNTSDLACIEAAIDAQIASLNADFAAENADIIKYSEILENCSPDADCVASDGACITFCVADQNHPAGYGLNDGDMAYTLGVFNGGGFGAGGTGAGADWAGYMNMFVIDGLGFGVADGIPGALNGDGVSQDGSFFGGPGFAPCSSGGTLNDDGFWNLGRTMTHEIGHYLGLYHTFQNGCADEPQTPFPVTDTPAQPNPSSGCPASDACGTLGACAAGESVQYNYMDYFDDACLVMFSQEQAAVMNSFSNSAAWATGKVSCTLPTYNPIVACSFRAAFDPADGTPLTICTDNGTSIQFADASSDGAISWDWTFSVTGTATVDVSSSTMQNPLINVTSSDGTSGTLTVELTSCDATGTCEVTTNTYPLTVLSGANCPNECDYTLNLTDTFGDGWDGASLEVFQDGVSLGTFIVGASFDSFILTLTDGSAIDLVYTAGAFVGENLYELIDPFGNTIFSDGPNPGPGTSFVAGCSTPTCDDGLQNGGEGGVDCGGTSPCPDCCNNGVQDDGETAVDCGGPNCATCPPCADGFDIVLSESFDACVQPAGWTVSSTDGGSIAGGDFSFSATPGSVPGGGVADPADFAGCIALISDDNADAVGIGCIISPIIDLSTYQNNSLNFDWHHEAFAGGGNLIVEVYDGTNWVQVFLADDDSAANDETVSLDAYINPAFQIRFCYDDEGGFQWGGAFDNIAVCGQSACTVTPAAISTTDPTEICADDGISDMINVTVDDAGTSANQAWVITDANGIVLALPAAPPFDLEGAGAGTCLIWLANIDDLAFAIAPGDDAVAVIAASPCAALSNSIAITRATNCAPPSEVPTVGEWGLIILGLMMSIVAIVGIRERQLAIRKS